MIPRAKIVKTEKNGSRVFLDGHELPGVMGITVTWGPGSLGPYAEINITAELEEYTVDAPAKTLEYASSDTGLNFVKVQVPSSK